MISIYHIAVAVALEKFNEFVQVKAGIEEENKIILFLYWGGGDDCTQLKGSSPTDKLDLYVSSYITQKHLETYSLILKL